jgi:hypothetical protein
VVAHDEARGAFLNRPGRREAARRQRHGVVLRDTLAAPRSQFACR